MHAGIMRFLPATGSSLVYFCIEFLCVSPLAGCGIEQERKREQERERWISLFWGPLNAYIRAWATTGVGKNRGYAVNWRTGLGQHTYKKSWQIKGVMLLIKGVTPLRTEGGPEHPLSRGSRFCAENCLHFGQFFAQRSLVSNCRGPRDRFQGSLKGDFNSAAKQHLQRFYEDKDEIWGSMFLSQCKAKIYLHEISDWTEATAGQFCLSFLSCPIRMPNLHINYSAYLLVVKDCNHCWLAFSEKGMPFYWIGLFLLPHSHSAQPKLLEGGQSENEILNIRTERRSTGV